MGMGRQYDVAIATQTMRTMSAMRDSVITFLKALKKTEPGVGACIAIAANHGCPYKGPSYTNEYHALINTFDIKEEDLI
jgi:hypothetical protein